MKDRYDKLALVAVILLIIARVSSVMTDMFITPFASSHGESASLLLRGMVLAVMPFHVAVNIAVGIWLFLEAKKDDRRSWVWMLLLWER